MLSPEEIIAEATGVRRSSSAPDTAKLSPEDIIAHVTKSTHSEEPTGSNSIHPSTPPRYGLPLDFNPEAVAGPKPNALERYRASRAFEPSRSFTGPVIKELLSAAGLGADVLRGTMKGHPLEGESSQEFFHAHQPMAESPGDPSAYIAGVIRNSAGLLVDPLVLGGPVISMLRRLSGALKSSGETLPQSIVPGSPQAQQLLLEGPPGSIKTGEMVWKPKIETKEIPIPGRTEERPTVKFEESRPTVGEFYRSRKTTESEQGIEDAIAAKQQLEVRDAEPGGYRLFETEEQASTHSGGPDVIGGVKSTYPDWYKQLTTKREGYSPLTRKQVEKALDHMANDTTPKHSEGRAYRLVREAIKDERLSDIYKSKDRAIIEEPIYGEQQFKPVETGETVTKTIPGGVMLNKVDRGAWEWVENPKAKPPQSHIDVLDTPEEAITSAPTPTERAARWNRWWDTATSKISPDIPLLRNIPNTPVISAIEQIKVKPELAFSEMEAQPWFKKLVETYRSEKGGETLKDLEQNATDFYRLKGGGPLNEHLAIKTLPEEVQASLAAQEEEFALENALRRELGYPETLRHEGPYLAHKVKSDMPRGEHFFTDIEALLNESPHTGASPLQTTLAGHQEHRLHGTMREGETAKFIYEHPVRAMIHRRVEGAQMRATLEMLRALKQDGILWPTEAEALAASPNGTVARMGHLWVRSKQEADFLAANIKEMTHNPIASWFNTYIRNPSLVIPYPHIMNNMGMKYLLARSNSGQMKGLWSDIKLYKDHRELVPPEEQALFDQLLPFSDTALQVRQRMNNLVPSGEFGDRAASAIGKINQWSSTKIFKEYDPAMRYALWKSYLRAGLEPQDAANRVWKDLIRYNIRSAWGDYLKAWAGNFFVPWRLGTWETTLRHLYSTPAKTAAFIGIFDLLREIDYRKTGNYTHMFWDYIERPVVTMLTHPSQAPRVALLTIALGPEGENTVMGLKRLFEVADGSADWKTVKYLIWGFAQTTGMMKEFDKAMQPGLSPTDRAGHFANIAMRFFINRHPVVFAPPRTWQGLPELASPLERSSAVRQQEENYGLWQEKKALKQQQKELRRELRP
ncbi:MAG: hypothetical protein D4R44_08095 [Actinobacteria bacterium]|nr:MAG: hypothetical protein D4R44_08095 [Actinomycetota bacterium]